MVCGCRNHTEIIARRKLVRSGSSCLKFNIHGIGPCHYQFGTGVNRIKSLPGSDCLGADRAILLADNAGPVHGPRQTAAPVHESGSDFDRPQIGEAVSAQSFVQTDGPDGRRRTQMATGNTIKLTAAGTDAEIKGWGPQPFNSALQAGRMNDVGRANAHALAALDAA